MKHLLTSLLLLIFIANLSIAESLTKTSMAPLNLGEITAQGWLEDQLQIQADGLSGHLDEFWPDIKNSQWFGGTAEGWERAPYWLDGIIPLAYTLDDKVLKAKVERYIDIILKKQDKDGWLGPKNDDIKNFDIWSQFLALKMLGQYQKATGREDVKVVMLKSLKRINQHISENPLRRWAKSRWFEALIAIHQLYEETGEEWLLETADMLKKQGTDWGGLFEKNPITEITPKGKWNHLGHVVNNAMAIKANGLYWRQSNDPKDKAAVYDIIEKLHKYHGMPTGVFTGDECLAGKNPTQGTELCSVVEYMYSLEILMSIFGDPAFGDSLEKITYNALPATFSPDMWSHQYDQQVNQVKCSIEKRNWTTNSNESNLFGLEPNYGCCTSDLSQGWPKFAAHLWMKKDAGLAAVAYAPCLVETKLDDKNVKVSVKTDYPFRDKIEITVTTDKPGKFPIYLRIPAWAKSPKIAIGKRTISPKPGTFHKINRKWKNSTKITLTVPSAPTIIRGYNNAASIQKGPLVYGLKIGEKWKAVNQNKPHRQHPHGDWEVHPTTPWNYALSVSEETIGQDITFVEKPMSKMPFAPDNAPITATVKAVKLPGWKIVNGSADTTPKSPVIAEGVIEEVTLIPYGCTNLRIAEFPTLIKGVLIKNNFN
jgi:hypothetical protein